MTMLILLVVLVLAGFAAAAARFGSDSRSLDSRQDRPDWPGVRHCS
jgi:hypothetical protein